MMKTAIVIALGTLTFPSLGTAESLGTAAKREQERRQKVEASGVTVPTFEGVGVPDDPKTKHDAQPSASSASISSSTGTGGRSDAEALRARGAEARSSADAAQRDYDKAMREQSKLPTGDARPRDRDGQPRADGMTVSEMMAWLKQNRDIQARQEAAKQRADSAGKAADDAEDKARRAGH